MLPNLRELWQMGTTFLLTVLAWIFFRASSLKVALEYITAMFRINHKSHQLFNKSEDLLLLLIVFTFLIIEWSSRHNLNAGRVINLPKNKTTRTLVYIMLSSIVVIYFFINNENSDFIYFQF